MVTTNEQMGPFLFDQTMLPYRLFIAPELQNINQGKMSQNVVPNIEVDQFCYDLWENRLIAQRKCHYLFCGLMIFLFRWWALRFSSNFLIRHLLLNLQWLIQSTETFPLSQEIGLNFEREKIICISILDILVNSSSEDISMCQADIHSANSKRQDSFSLS